VGISWLTFELLGSEDNVLFMQLGFRLLGWLFGWVGLVNLV
jgi:hypothetical protein